MAGEPLSEHCSLMSKPGGPPKPAVRPSDCPKDAVYIRSLGNSDFTVPGTMPFPLVFEGGDGDDKLTVIGSGGKPIVMSGGKGNDSLLVEDEWIWLVDRIGVAGTIGLGVVAIVFIAIAIVAWRALGSGSRRAR